jgi:hypothetical protein
MKIIKSIIYASIAAIGLAATGCSSVGNERGGSTSTSVSFNRNNYQIIQANAIGHSYGFWMLGIVPIVSPTYSAAKTRLYRSVSVPLTGKAVALANQTWDRSNIYLILFSIPRITITADVIQFTGSPDEKSSGSN